MRSTIGERRTESALWREAERCFRLARQVCDERAARTLEELGFELLARADEEAPGGRPEERLFPRSNPKS
jgi:hypothetical protein